MTDISRDDINNDIELVNGDLKLTSDISLVEGIRQDIRARLMTFEGEYFLDTAGNQVGVPWIQEIFKSKPLSFEHADYIIRRFILNTNGISSVESLNFEFARGNRQLDITFTALTNDGSLITDNIQGIG